MDFNGLLNDIVYALVVVILPILTKYIVSALKEFVDSKRTITQGDVINDYIDNAERIVENIVVALNQTIVDTAKKNNTWNENTAEEVKNAAIETATKLIADNAKLAISTTYNSFSQWLDIQIEKTVNDKK